MRRASGEPKHRHPIAEIMEVRRTLTVSGVSSRHGWALAGALRHAYALLLARGLLAAVQVGNDPALGSSKGEKLEAPGFNGLVRLATESGSAPLTQLPTVRLQKVVITDEANHALLFRVDDGQLLIMGDSHQFEGER